MQKTHVFLDGAGRLISQTTPEAGTTLFAYDNNGNLASTQNQNATSNTTQYKYDTLNRLITATVGGGPTYTYTYEAQDTSGDAFGKGLLTSTTNSGNVQTQ
jgi:YD repeat-containing protein